MFSKDRLIYEFEIILSFCTSLWAKYLFHHRKHEKMLAGENQGKRFSQTFSFFILSFRFVLNDDHFQPWLCFFCRMAKVSHTPLLCIPTPYSSSIIYFPCQRFFKETPTQQTLPRRCCRSPHWRASSESVLLPGKQALHCALKCMDVRSQVGDLHAYLHSRLSLMFAGNQLSTHTRPVWQVLFCLLCIPILVPVAQTLPGVRGFGISVLRVE